MADPSMRCRESSGGGEGDGMRTVECLRGRLLAERVASKAAKEEADLLAKRLDELEKKLSDEIKCRNKAERRIRKALKKLEALKILDVELSDSSIGSLSSNCFSGDQAVEMDERRPGSLSSGDSERSGRLEEAKGSEDGDGGSAGGSSAGSCTQVSSMAGGWCSGGSEQSLSGRCKEEEHHHTNVEDSKECGFEEGVDDHDSDRQQLVAANGSAKSEDYRDEVDDRLALALVEPQHNVKADEPKTEDDEQAANFEAQAPEEEENRLALVVFEHQPRKEPEKLKIDNNVQAVLLALQQVKEQLRYTIER